VTDLSFADGSSATDGTSNFSSDTTTVDYATTIQIDNDNPVIETSSADDDSTQPNYLSSLSFFDLVETMFIKKEDIKPVENIEQVPTNVEEESINTATISEEIPVISTNHEQESETLINNNSEEMGTTLD
jgi:hypothetical protein